MELISTTTVGAGGAASIDLTAIPGTYTDLLLVFSARDTTAGSTDGGFALRFNSDSGSNYSHKRLGGNGSAASSGSSSSVTLFGNAGFGGDPYAGTTANTFGNVSIYIPNYAGSTAKTMSADAVGENNATAAYSSIVAGAWTGTAAITSITLLPATLFAQYSTASLYGILKGSGGATAA